MEKRSKSIDFDKELYGFLTKNMILLRRSNILEKKFDFWYGGVIVTSLNRDRVVTDFWKVKDLLAKSYTFVAWGGKVNVNTMFLNKENRFLF